MHLNSAAYYLSKDSRFWKLCVCLAVAGMFRLSRTMQSADCRLACSVCIVNKSVLSGYVNVIDLYF